MRVNLVVIEGVQQGKVIPLTTERFEIGRGEDCQLRPKSQTVSLRQCAILRRGRHVTVEDLGSTNGTLVNERCLRLGDEARVSDGDRLQVGQLIFVFRIEAGPEEKGGGPEDWLIFAPTPGPAPEVDMKSRTVMMASPVPKDPLAADRASGRFSAPSPDAHAAQFAFALRLNKMLFRWFAPADRFRVLERFYRLPEPTIRRFYALASTGLDRARIFVGRPPRGLSVRGMLRDMIGGAP